MEPNELSSPTSTENTAQLSPELSDDETAASLGFITTLSEHAMGLGNEEEPTEETPEEAPAEEIPQDTPVPEETPVLPEEEPEEPEDTGEERLASLEEEMQSFREEVTKSIEDSMGEVKNMIKDLNEDNQRDK